MSEYIRRRRLTQAAFDLRQGKGKVIDIALKYGYDSPSAFARAFKELHGAAPSAARREGVLLKTYPPVSFLLTIRGEHAMEFRIEKREAFQIVGLSGWEDPECGSDDTLTPHGGSLWTAATPVSTTAAEGTACTPGPSGRWRHTVSIRKAAGCGL